MVRRGGISAAILTAQLETVANRLGGLSEQRRLVVPVSQAREARSFASTLEGVFFFVGKVWKSADTLNAVSIVCPRIPEPVVQPLLLKILSQFQHQKGVWQAGIHGHGIHGKNGRRIGFLMLLLLVALPLRFNDPLPTLAAPSAKDVRPRRFFESLLNLPDGPQKLIDAPTPPTAQEVERPLRLAAVPQSPVGKRDGKSAEALQPSSPEGTPAALAVPVRLPKWNEATDFATALTVSAHKVVLSAVDPHFKPLPKAPLTTLKPVAPKKTSTSVPTTAQQASRVRKVVNSQSDPNQPSGAAAPKTQRLEKLRVRIAQTLATYQRRPLNTAQNTPWEVMHGFIAFGIPTRLRVGGPAGDAVNAIGWSNMAGRCKGQVMLAAADNRLMAMKGIGVQGHSAQYLAILAQCRVALDSPITIQSQSFTVADLVKEEKLSCKSNTELTFALIALSHYLPADTNWKSRDGKSWSLEKLVAEEIEQPIRGAPCGGTHRLFGLAYGCQRRLKATGQLDGVYLRADKFVRDYQKFTFAKLQNPDGSFSTEWFKYPADRSDDIDRKIQTSGHILEWLTASLDQESLYSPRVLAAAEFLTSALAREPSREWKIGPLGHALHALSIYQERVWGVVLPGGIAAFHGPMKAIPSPSQLARRPTDSLPPSGGAAGKPTQH